MNNNTFQALQEQCFLWERGTIFSADFHFFSAYYLQHTLKDKENPKKPNVAS